ncbi:MAG: hypothetical protein CVU57_28740 [Deltaproteobacteria bacterium HGW-Deltaproteobacteria-15]|jgi:hypothetical protein|nr:MAG: hypothetical protein CVU57_28740 [Deltaproteobacteria bacterium HGW-Deltaproteobacteria-15]
MDARVNGKPASRRQLAYIRQLRTEIGDVGPGISNDLTSVEASQLIGKLVGRLRPNELSTGNGHGSRVVKINEPRLGMAMKECFRLMAGNGWDVYADKRRQYIEKVIRTYFLFTEVAERLGGGLQEEKEIPSHIAASLEGPAVDEAAVA